MTDHGPANLDRGVDAHVDRMIQVRRHLHAHPELSGDETRTADYLCNQVKQAGLEPQRVADGRGLLVDLPGSDDNDGIGIRADIDALPIEDAKSVDYRSKVLGVMHACGHDGHAAVVLGALLTLADAQRSGGLPHPVRCRAIFQPAEETAQGALHMVKAGAVDGLGALIGLHMDPARPAGAIALKEGVVTADCDALHIEVHGRGGHASRPHESLDPIAAAAQLISSIYLFIPRAIDTHDPVVVTIGYINGGSGYNTIPDRVTLGGTMRSFDSRTRLAAIEHIEKLARGLAEASGTRIEMRVQSGPPHVYNDPGLTELVRSAATRLLGGDHVLPIERPSMGGEDFSNYLTRVRGCMFRLGCGPPAGGGAPLHSARFDLDESSLAIGAKILVRAVVGWAGAKDRE